MDVSSVPQESAPQQDTWGHSDPLGPAVDVNGAPMAAEQAPDLDSSDRPRQSTDGHGGHSDKNRDPSFREKQAKPNKIYIGGLPEHTLPEDLRSCFEKIGKIVAVELKAGYGFVEFDTREAADESVAKYDEGYFMGNKIRVEISKSTVKASRGSGDPDACFKCGRVGHWARQCPDSSSSPRRSNRDDRDRMYTSRDYLPPPPVRDHRPYRDEYVPPPGPYPPPRDPGLYDYPPRDYRRPPSPPRDYRDYGTPSMRPPRDYDDYRLRGPPPPPLDCPGFYAERDGPPPHVSRGYPARDPYDRRALPDDRYAYPPVGVRPRTPPLPPRLSDVRVYDPVDGRGRPPPHYSGPIREHGYRRRSHSPPRRSGGATYNGAPYSGDGFAGNGYLNSSPSAGPPRNGAVLKDYSMQGVRESRDAEQPSYRRA